MCVCIWYSIHDDTKVVIILAMIGPEKRKQDSVKDHMEVGHVKDNESYLEKAHEQRSESALGAKTIT